MINAIKVILMLAIMLLMCYPFITAKGALRVLFVASKLKYEAPDNRKNVFFVLLSLIEFIVVVLLFKVFDTLTALVYSIPWIGSLFLNISNSLNSQIDYILFVIKIFIVNLLIVYAFIILKALLKKCFINPIFKIGKGKKLKLSFKKIGRAHV